MFFFLLFGFQENLFAESLESLFSMFNFIKFIMYSKCALTDKVAKFNFPDIYDGIEGGKGEERWVRINRITSIKI